jgi:monothiol glutaredoxin
MLINYGFDKLGVYFIHQFVYNYHRIDIIFISFGSVLIMEDNKTFDFINDQIKNNKIVLFMKGTTDFPQCGFSAMVSNILHKMGVKFKDINVLENADLRQGIKEFSDWPTIPQLYIEGEFVGGCDIVREMYESGELSALTNDSTD